MVALVSLLLGAFTAKSTTTTPVVEEEIKPPPVVETTTTATVDETVQGQVEQTKTTEEGSTD